MRKSREASEIVEKTIKEIKMSEKITDELIKKTCKKYAISEGHIRLVAGWK